MSRQSKFTCMAPECHRPVIKSMTGHVYGKRKRYINSEVVRVYACSSRCYSLAEAFLYDPQNQITENESTTFKDIIDYWVEHRAMYTKKYRPTSSREYRNRIQQATWWSERIGEYDIDEITMDLLERSFIELSSIRAAKTAVKYKWTLGLIYASAIKRGLYNGRNLGRELEEPLDDKTQLVPLRDGEEVGNTLRPEDMQRVFDEFPRKTFLQWNVYLAVMLNAHTGLRAAELTGLEPRHFLNNNQEIRVEQELLQSWDADTKASYWEIDPSLKGRQSRTVVVWDSQLISQLLAEHLKRKSQQRMRLGVEWEETGLLLCDHRGGFLTRDNLLKGWQRGCEKLSEPIMWERVGHSDKNGDRKRTMRAPELKALRHTFASLSMKGSGLDTMEVRNQLGHQHLATTEIYLKNDPVLARRGVAEKLEGSPLVRPATNR